MGMLRACGISGTATVTWSIFRDEQPRLAVGESAIEGTTRMMASEGFRQRWMVIGIENNHADQAASVLLSDVSERVARNYARGFNQAGNRAGEREVTAVVCRCP